MIDIMSVLGMFSNLCILGGGGIVVFFKKTLLSIQTQSLNQHNLQNLFKNKFEL